MAEYLHGAVCSDCGQVITVPADICDVYDAMGAWCDVSIEVDMRAWDAHARGHREQPLVFNILSREASDGIDWPGAQG